MRNPALLSGSIYLILYIGKNTVFNFNPDLNSRVLRRRLLKLLIAVILLVLFLLTLVYSTGTSEQIEMESYSLEKDKLEL